jgi:uncharacterized protein
MNERRIIVAEVRAAIGQDMRVTGLAARYNSPTKLIGARGKFVERIMRGAFSRAIDEKQDVAFLINHDPNRLMARVSSGTLRLRDTDDGLSFEADLDPDSPDARNAYSAIKRGDMHQCSFGFGDCDADFDMAEDPDDRTVKMPRRSIRDIKVLADVSAVTYPAYTDTSVKARSIEQRSEVVIPDEFIVIPEPVQDAADVVARRRQLLTSIL